MVSLKSEELEDFKPLTASPTRSRDELKHWEKLSFTFDMDRDPSGSSRAHSSRNNQRSRSDSASVQSGGANTSALQDAALLAQFAAAANHGGIDVNHGFPPVLPPGQYPSLGPTPAFYGNFFHHDGMPPANQLPSLSTMDFPWPHMSSPPQHHGSLPYHPHPQSPSTSTMTSSSSPTSTFVPSPYPIPPLPPPQEISSSRSARGRSSSTTEDLTEAERGVIGEEKRRRNTAASARFRIKKKQKTVNLERSVSDLTGRAEELEREVSDLRRENGWLKEIVMLKGTRFAAANVSHRAALNQAAALALGGQPPGGPAASSSSQGFAEGSGHRHTEELSEEESESSDEEDAPNPKGKGNAGSSGRN
ncbi:hypothetical protein EST38_g2946 [Candolleomyces aberdarensis]|uniref:BZIP domain-containing protein n=1 Tax=Candolleomyces aberdarensis TaxID=2316362 RepID=A0A4Q2DU97_9AGAR|nr:hypothetical protein EST38_g2946 [Candolleomyces aberdarensis]